VVCGARICAPREQRAHAVQAVEVRGLVQRRTPVLARAQRSTSVTATWVHKRQQATLCFKADA
jgi:hypothetical protein